MTPPAAAAVVAEGVSTTDALEALGRLLDETASLVMQIDEAIYRARPFPRASGSVGGHVRHCLDHVAALVSRTSGVLSYDHRQRDTRVEQEPSAALQAIIRLRAGLSRLDSRPLDEPVQLRCAIDESGDALETWSSLGREMAFVLSHTIHHQALIGVLLAAQGFDTTDGFGYAPTTPRPR